MRILLVRPRPHKDTINLQSFMICEPLELEILATALEKEGHEVEVLDMLFCKKSITKYLKTKYDYICFTAYMVHVNIVKEYARRIKAFDKSIITVVGGIHAEVAPFDFESPYIDYIVARDPINTIVNIINKKDVLGYVYDKSTKLVPITINSTPVLPNREITAKYRKKYNYVLHSRCATIKTSFGCPFQCEFCFCTAITNHQYACRKLDEVIIELKLIKEKNVFIVDDNFLRNKEFIYNFCNELKKNNINKNYILFGRADFISANEDCIKELKEVGLQSVFIGIESFKKSELDLVCKRTNVEMNINAIKILEKYDVESYMGLICQYDWTREDFDNLITYLNQFERPFINLQPITPIVGTKLYDKEKDSILLNRESFHLWDMAHLCKMPENMSIRAFYKNILRVYYKTSASRRMRKYIKKRYGLRVYLRCLYGAYKISGQYRKLARKNKINF